MGVNDRSRVRVPTMWKNAGLRLKFNLVLVPTVALGIAAIVWVDYRHEYQTLMEAHAGHVSRVDDGAAARPAEPSTLPDAATRRSLRLHAATGGALLVVVMVMVNVTLQALILRPVASMRERLGRLQRGQWRGGDPAVAGTDDEIGVLANGFRQVGAEIDALVCQILHAERLAVVALVSKRVEARVEPEVRRIGEVAARLTSREPADARQAGESLGRAAAEILRAVHEYDAVFTERANGNGARRGTARDAA